MTRKTISIFINSRNANSVKQLKVCNSNVVSIYLVSDEGYCHDYLAIKSDDGRTCNRILRPSDLKDINGLIDEILDNWTNQD